MVTETLLTDLFNIEHRATDVHIDHFCDALSDIGFEVVKIENFDVSVYMKFEIVGIDTAKLDGQLVIDRMSKTFEIGAKLDIIDCPEDSVNYAGMASEDFKEIERYLELLRQDCLQYLEALCIETGRYEWHGLRFKTTV